MKPPIEISIIIATRNREDVLYKTLEAANEAIKDVTNTEVIVVNDGDNELSSIVDTFSSIKFYKNPGRGVACARNFGTSKAIGSTLFFVDDDMWVNKQALHWISENIINDNEAVYNLNWHYPPQLNQQLNKTKVGQYLLSTGFNTMWGRMVTGQKKEPVNGKYLFNCIMSGSLVISKTIFNNAGGYNEAMIFQGEDTDLTIKLSQNNIKMFCVFDVLLFHNQQDRFDINAFLARVSNGFRSEFDAAKSGHISKRTTATYSTARRIIFSLFCLTENFWIACLNRLPNNTFFRPLNNKLIGMLSGMQLFKQWKLYKVS